MRKIVAFVTYLEKPSITEDDSSIIPFLNKNDVEVAAAAWDDSSVDWTRFALVVIRSCWNYHLQPEEFSEWVSKLESQNIKVLNPPSILKWNMNKFYLKELHEKGVSMARTRWIQKRTSITLNQVVTELGVRKAVVKPCIAATAYKTFLVEENSPGLEEKFSDLLQSHDLMVQEFIPEIQTLGEWSLIFFDKKFSHAVIKKAKANDFRVQNNFGGTHSVELPDDLILAQAEKILSMVRSPLLYARIDGVMSGERFLLMELELIEPMLFLDSGKEAQQGFAESIIRAVI